MEEKNKSSFDIKKFESEAIEQLRSGKALEGKDGVLAPLIKRLVEASLSGEIDAHLTDAKGKNRRNGKGGKQVKTAFGSVEIHTPRDRLGDFEPQILAKRQTTLGEGIDHKVISLYGLGMMLASLFLFYSCIYFSDEKHISEQRGTTSSSRIK